MATDAEARGPQITVGADARITRSGAFLRNYKIDEFPQFPIALSYTEMRAEIDKASQRI